jgi:tRNA threonylcarbamoyladenosine biosynthesis protein TsaE
MRLPELRDTQVAGELLGQELRPGDVVALSGDLGAGKTALAKGIARGLGFDGEVSSPTFPIVQVYDGPEMRVPLWHVDLYRIENLLAIEELGLDEAREHAALVIEWPERLGARLWPDALRLEIARTNGEERALTAIVPAAWEARCPLR